MIHPEPVPATRRARPTAAWEGRGGRRIVEVEGVRYRLSRIAGRTGAGGLLCEAPIGAAIPDCTIRRRIRARLDRPGSRRLIVFTDAARSAEVWSWGSRGRDGAAVLHERTLRSGEVPDVAVTLVSRDRAGHAHRIAGGPDLAAAIAGTVLRRATRWHPPLLRDDGVAWRLLRNHPARYGAADFPHSERGAVVLPPGAGASQLLYDLLADCSSPDTVRAVWRGVLGLRILDPACGTGDWLIEVMEVLEPIYTTCLERMQGWVDEEILERRRPRSTRRRDFRALLSRAGDTRMYATPLAFARETIVLWNLYGADRGARKVARCRRRLVRRAATTSPFPCVACNLLVGDPRRGLETRRAVARALAGRGNARVTLERIAEAAEAVARADRLLRRMRTEQGVAARTVEAGIRAIQRRLDSTRCELDSLLLRASGVPAGDTRAGERWLRLHRPLHPFAEWNEVIRRGGFDMVRGVGE